MPRKKRKSTRKRRRGLGMSVDLRFFDNALMRQLALGDCASALRTSIAYATALGMTKSLRLEEVTKIVLDRCVR